MRLFLLTFFAISILFLALPSVSQPSNSQKTIKIISWNIYMLPRFIKNTGKLERAKKIGAHLQTEDVDVIVFQEAFHGGARRRIHERLKQLFPYVAGPANRDSWSLKANSGVWIFSKYPIDNQSSIIFKSKYGIDALSKKGALLVEINVNGKQIQVVGTHLQNAGKAEFKQSQCREIYTHLLKKFERPLVPQIICGDFNIEKQSAAYDGMLLSLDAEDGDVSGTQHFTYDRLTNDLQTEGGEKRDLIDYILLRANQPYIKCISRIITPIKIKWHKSHHDLSDHYPIIAEIQLENSAVASFVP